MNKSVDKNLIKLSDGTEAFLQGNGVYCINKVFFSSVNEEKWLNFVASQGLELCGRAFGKYFFNKNTQADRYYYSVGYSLVSSSQGELCDITEKEVNQRAEENCLLVCTYCTKVYYKTLVGGAGARGVASDAPAKDAASKRCHVRNRFVFNLVLFCFSLGLLCYNLMYWVRFNASNYFVRFTKDMLHDYQEKEFSIWDVTIDLRGWFGEFSCVPHISLFLFLSLLLLPFVVYYFDQYMYARSFEKSMMKKWAKK